MKFKKWNIHTPAEQDVVRLREAGYPYLLSTVLAARGITTAEAAAEFLDRERSLTLSPMQMRDILRSDFPICVYSIAIFLSKRAKNKGAPSWNTFIIDLLTINV